MERFQTQAIDLPGVLGLANGAARLMGMRAIAKPARARCLDNLGESARQTPLVTHERQAAQARGLTSALVSVGGNLRAIGKKPDGSQWTGGVENPWNASEVYTTDSLFGAAINMSDMALVTSGDYQRYFVVDGKRYHHIIDPDTLWPAAYYNGVTVLCPDSGMADCLTTALFCMPLEEGQKLVESLDGVEAMWCTPDKQATTSSGWDSHLKK